MADRTPPHDRLAEQAVLGACLTKGKMLTEAEVLHGGDFYIPAHEMIWAAISALSGSSKPCDSIAVNSLLVERKLSRETGGAVYLFELQQTVPAILTSVGFYVEKVLDRATRRAGIIASQQNEKEFYESEDDALTILDRAEQTLGKVPARETGDPDSLMNLDEFVEQHMPPEEWVIPGLLGRGDRFILTGIESLGKSTLARQIAVCAAAGMNPFTGVSYVPQHVLAIDLENPKRLMMDRFEQLRAAVRRHGYTVDPNNLWLDRRPAGINLLDAADRRWLNKRMAACNPSLLVIGPIYKMYEDEGRDSSGEKGAKAFASVIDDFRERYDCAVVMEHHMAKGDQHGPRPVAPIGSTLWMRWPEFGYGLRPVVQKGVSASDQEARRLVEFVPWKKRDERGWPSHLESGGSGMPWVETVDVDNRFGRAS